MALVTVEQNEIEIEQASLSVLARFQAFVTLLEKINSLLVSQQKKKRRRESDFRLENCFQDGTGGRGSLVFIDDVTADASRMDSQPFSGILLICSYSTKCLRTQLDGQRSTVQMDNDLKHTVKAPEDLID